MEVVGQKSAFKKDRVLIVEDSSIARKFLSQILRAIGYKELDEAKHGKEALELIKRNNYCVVISDWTMPEMDGLELVKRVRKDLQKTNLPFLMLTANDARDEVLAAMQAGATSYIVKPYNQATIEEKLLEVLGSLPES